MATRFVNKKTLVIAILAAGAITAILAAATFAQARASTYGPGFWMHGGPPGYFGGGPYDHSGGMMYQGLEANWTGSVSVEEIRSDLMDMLRSKVNATVGEAESAAKQSLGDGSEVWRVTLAPVNGYLVYAVHGIDSSNNPHTIIVDAGDGKVLDSAKVDTQGFGAWKGHEYGGGMWR